MKYTITAECVRHGRVQVVRSQVQKRSTSGQVYTIEQVVCPKCRLWADVLDIQEVSSPRTPRLINGSRKKSP